MAKAGMMGMSTMTSGGAADTMPPSALPGFPGASHMYHIGATETGLGFCWLDVVHPDDREDSGKTFHARALRLDCIAPPARAVAHDQQLLRRPRQALSVKLR